MAITSTNVPLSSARLPTSFQQPRILYLELKFEAEQKFDYYFETNTPAAPKRCLKYTTSRTLWSFFILLIAFKYQHEIHMVLIIWPNTWLLLLKNWTLKSLDFGWVWFLNVLYRIIYCILEISSNYFDVLWKILIRC